jgi:hypothetical protein
MKVYHRGCPIISRSCIEINRDEKRLAEKSSLMFEGARDSECMISKSCRLNNV